MGKIRTKYMCGTSEELVVMTIGKLQIFDRFSLTAEHIRVNLLCAAIEYALK